MKQIRIWVIAIFCLLGLSTTRALAQAPISVQHLNFSFFNDFESDTSVTNGANSHTTSLIRTAAVVSGNVDHAVYYDLAGPKWSNLLGMGIVREVNLSNNAEGIYLRGFGRQSNISDMFGSSYIGAFTSLVTNEFPGFTNNFDAGLPIRRGSESFVNGVATATNTIRSEQLFFISFTTTNLKFNYVGYGTSVPHPVVGRVTKGGTIFSNSINSFIGHGVGVLYHTAGTNVFNQGAAPPIPEAGPMYGTFIIDEPNFVVLTNGPE